MKIFLIVTVLVFLFSGCGSRRVVETVNDSYVQPVMAQMQQIVVSLPMDATVETIQDDHVGTIYLCDGYTVTTQILPAEDIDHTLHYATGFSADNLRPVHTKLGELERTQCVWTAAGESEEQVGQLTVLDDGNYHYILSCVAGASQVERLKPVWEELFDSFRLVSDQAQLNIGS